MTTNNQQDPPKFMAIHTGESLFIGDVWQVYRHEPSGDTTNALNYINHEPTNLYKTQESCEARCRKLGEEP